MNAKVLLAASIVVAVVVGGACAAYVSAQRAQQAQAAAEYLVGKLQCIADRDTFRDGGYLSFKMF